MSSFDEKKHHQSEHYIEDASLDRLDHNGKPVTGEAPMGEHDDLNWGFAPELVKRVNRKVDWRVVPVLSLMYCISLIDRTNLSLARAANNLKMDHDLKLREGNNRYGLATLIFFPTYIIFEIPSQIGLRKFGAARWLGSATILWGIIMLAMGFVPDWRGLVALRAVLGIFEATLFPGAAYLIACWYPRRMMATRNVFFYITSIVVSGLSSMFAWGLSHMDGIAGKSGWRWIFIITGILTVVIGFIGLVGITDFPDKAKFLNAEEKNMILTRIDRDRGDAEPDALTMKKIGGYMCEPKLYMFAYFFVSTTLATYSLAYFLPAILKSMDFNNMQSQLLMAPPYVWCIFPGLVSAYTADKLKQRALPLMFNATCVIIGTCMYSKLSLTQKAARYAGIFLAIGGANSNVPLIVSWCHTAIRAQSKRAYASALVVAAGGIGGILSGVAFMEKEAKLGYPTGVHLTLACNAGIIVGAGCLSLWFRRQNRRADRGEIIIEHSPTFRYQA